MNADERRGYEKSSNDVEDFLRMQGFLTPDIAIVAFILLERFKGELVKFNELNERAGQLMDEVEALLKEARE